MTFWEVQERNVRKSIILIAVFSLIMVSFGFLVDAIFNSFPVGMSIFSIIALVQILVGLSKGPEMVLKMVEARPANPENFEEKQLINIVEEMTIASGLGKPPKVYVMEDETINAFATGYKPEKSAICVTTGLLKNLNREETEGVIGHEISHILHKDTLVMTLTSAILGAVVIIQILSWRAGLSMLRYSYPRRRKNSGLQIALLLLFIALLATLFAFLGRIVLFAVSRSREYLADATSAQLTRNPFALASALRKIYKVNKKKMKNANIANAHLFISDPLRRKINERKEGFFTNLFSTHPPIYKRIALLENKPPEIVLKELENL
ncbi:MAG: M48 family metallopeptidase [Thermotogaceae bacterium]|nr:M48 family metallopeptidase [Thermotogaceae bacterium]RKX53886.1 MAG: peptidase M48 [Thermotoga sp.]